MISVYDIVIRYSLTIVTSLYKYTIIYRQVMITCCCHDCAISRSTICYGRYIYAVGGNAEAARLTGVPVGRVIILVYAVSGLAAGLGGCLQASLVRAAAPNMANMYELYVIAAVVVGGTSLSGGSGRMFGTLIGAFIIAVIQNGMNLLGINSYAQMFTLGAVIVLAVLLDKARQSGGFRQLLTNHTP